MVVGTIAYMSPQQASGQTLDARSDIFSFGVVLYELLARRRPIVGSTDLEVLQKVIHETPQPLGPEVPVSLRMMVEKALAKDPAERYQSMRELVVDLRRLIRQSGEATAPDMRRQRARWKWATLAALVLLVALAGGATLFFRSRQPSAPARLEYTQLTNFADSA